MGVVHNPDNLHEKKPIIVIASAQPAFGWLYVIKHFHIIYQIGIGIEIQIEIRIDADTDKLKWVYLFF